MTELSRADLRGALELVRRVESAPDVGSFRVETITGVRELVRCDVAHFGELDPVRGRATALDSPRGAVGREATIGFQRNFAEDPTVARQVRAGEGRVLKVSDFVGIRGVDEDRRLQRVPPADRQSARDRAQGSRAVADPDLRRAPSR